MTVFFRYAKGGIGVCLKLGNRLSFSSAAESRESDRTAARSDTASSAAGKVHPSERPDDGQFSLSAGHCRWDEQLVYLFGVLCLPVKKLQKACAKRFSEAFLVISDRKGKCLSVRSGRFRLHNPYGLFRCSFGSVAAVLIAAHHPVEDQAGDKKDNDCTGADDKA